MSGPRPNALQELHIPNFTNWDRVWSVNQILQELEAGVFFNASLLTTQMLRDDRIRGCYSVRSQAVLGMPTHMEPAQHTAKKRAKKIADEAAELWPRMAPRAELSELLKWALFLGVGLAQKTWDRDEKAWLPCIRTWHAGALTYDITEEAYRVQYQGGQFLLSPNDSNWLLCTPFGYKYGRSNGLLGPLAMPYLCRQWAFRDRARHSETFGQAFKKLVHPPGAVQASVDAARRAVARVGTETVIVLEQGEEGNRWDVELVEAQTTADETFSGQIDHLDDVIAVTLLGQTSSTKGQAGLGSQEKAGGDVRLDVMRFDASLLQDIAYTGLLRDWTLRNHGDADLAPRLVIEVDPPEDVQHKATAMVQVAAAIAAFRAEGVNVDVQAVVEEAGIPLLAGMEAVTPPEETEETDVEGDEESEESDDSEEDPNL